MKRQDLINIVRTVIKWQHSDDAYAFQNSEISLGALADRLAPSILDRLEEEGALEKKGKLETDILPRGEDCFVETLTSVKAGQLTSLLSQSSKTVDTHGILRKHKIVADYPGFYNLDLYFNLKSEVAINDFIRVYSKKNLGDRVCINTLTSNMRGCSSRFETLEGDVFEFFVDVPADAEVLFRLKRW